jgi:FHS family L-fucose permease-like MFS transporter
MNNNHSIHTLPVIISVFFFWGFVAAGNGILIPVYKEYLNLEQSQTMLIDFAFYVAYAVGTLIYLMVSEYLGCDLLNKIGYKNGIALGLCISASGTLLFIPAANYESFYILISGLFIVGLGFSLQQTAANPLVINIGNPQKGAQRLSLAGGVNNIGTMVGPILLTLALFGSVNSGTSKLDIQSIKIPYLILGGAFFLVALIFKYSSVPNNVLHHSSNEENTHSHSTDVPDNFNTYESRKKITKYPQLILGMIAIFVYVGAEVSTVSNLPEYMRQELGIGSDEVAPYVSLFWASLMIGRWASAASNFSDARNIKSLLGFIFPYLAFALFLLVNYLYGTNVQQFLIYIPVILILVCADYFTKHHPALQLLVFSLLAVLALLIGMISGGWISVYAFISVGLFCSTLWPCIFTLAIAGLGTHTNKGSGLLIMMIMGGGIISVFQGFLAKENLLGIQHSYWLIICCFVYLGWYALKAKSILKNQGIVYEAGIGH